MNTLGFLRTLLLEVSNIGSSIFSTKIKRKWDIFIVPPFITLLVFLFLPISAFAYLFPSVCSEKAVLKTELIGKSPEDILLNCEHDQGKEGTCGFHAVTAALTALYKLEQKLYGHHEKMAMNYHVADLIEKLEGTLASRINSTTGLLKARKLDFLAQNNHGFSIVKLGESLNSGQRNSNHNFPIKFESVIKNYQEILEKEYSSPATSILVATRFERQKYQVPLPKYNLEVTSSWKNEQQIEHEIVSYFSKEHESRLPLVLDLCTGFPCSQHGHAVLVTGVSKVTCTQENGSTEEHYAADLQNSWGGKDNGPFKLDQIAKGMLNRNSAISKISLCGSLTTPPCQDGIINEANPMAHALRHYIDAGDLVGVKRVLRLPGTIVDQPDFDGYTALATAFYNGNVELILELLNHGAALDQLDKALRTPLVLASEKGYLPVVELLLKKGVSPNDDNYVLTPLDSAVESGHLEVVKLLLDAGAKVNTKYGYYGPLEAAIEHGFPEIEAELRKRGAVLRPKYVPDGLFLWY